VDDNTPKALFLGPNGKTYPDYLVCSGVLPVELAGKPCPFSQDGRIPDPVPLDPNSPDYTVDKGRPKDLCPPCAKQQLSTLAHWESDKTRYSDQLLPLRLFKCRQWFWLVIPGLLDSNPTALNS
jgi:hypothetical protein